MRLSNARVNCAPCSLKCYIVGVLKHDERRIKRSPKKSPSLGRSAPVQFPPPSPLKPTKRTEPARTPLPKPMRMHGLPM